MGVADTADVSLAAVLAESGVMPLSPNCDNIPVDWFGNLLSNDITLSGINALSSDNLLSDPGFNSNTTLDVTTIANIKANPNSKLGTLDLHVGYVEIKTVDFTGDHGVLRTNWKYEDWDWVWDDSETYSGTIIDVPEWNVNRKTSTGQSVSYGASYTKGSKVSVNAGLEIDTGGREYRISGNDSQYLNFATSPWSTAQGTATWTVTSLTALPSSVAIVES